MWEHVIIFNASLQGISCPPARVMCNGVSASAGAQPTVHTPVDVTPDTGRHQVAPEPDATSLLQQLFQELADDLAELERRRKNNLSEMQQLAVEIATAVAKRFLHREVQAGKVDIEKLVSAAIARFAADAALTVELHPQDLQLLQHIGSKKFELLNHGRHIRFRANPALTRGNCRVDADHYGVLFDWETQLAEINATLLRTLDDAQIERRKTRPDNRQLGRFPDRRETA